MIRVLIADDNAVIRHGVAALLEASADDIEVVGEASTGREAVERARELKPDVVLLDIRMPVMDGVEAAGLLSSEFKVMMLSYGREEGQVTGAIKAGALGYLVHGRFEAEELERAVRDVAAGRTVVSPAVASIVFGAVRHGAEGSDGSDPYELTARELEVVQLVAKGRSNRQIADELVVSEKTVKNHVHNVYVKLGVKRRAEAIAKWLGTAGTMLALALTGMGCSDEEAPRDELSKPAAIERVEGICNAISKRIEGVGPEPPIRTGGKAEVDRFVAWQERAFEETESGLREIERVPVPRDGSERYLHAYVRLARGVVDAQRKLVLAAKDENDVAASGLRSRRETSVKLAGQAATRYGLSRCGGSAR